MECQFQGKLLQLQVEEALLPQLGSSVTSLLVEMIRPKDLKDEVGQRNRRIQLLETFCEKWKVDKYWANDLIDLYEDSIKTDGGHSLRVWLNDLAGDQTRDLPSPRVEPDVYPVLRLV